MEVLEKLLDLRLMIPLGIASFVSLLRLLFKQLSVDGFLASIFCAAIPVYFTTVNGIVLPEAIYIFAAFQVLMFITELIFGGIVRSRPVVADTLDSVILCYIFPIVAAFEYQGNMNKMHLIAYGAMVFYIWIDKLATCIGTTSRKHPKLFWSSIAVSKGTPGGVTGRGSFAYLLGTAISTGIFYYIAKDRLLGPGPNEWVTLGIFAVVAYVAALLDSSMGAIFKPISRFKVSKGYYKQVRQMKKAGQKVKMRLSTTTINLFCSGIIYLMVYILFVII